MSQSPSAASLETFAGPVAEMWRKSGWEVSEPPAGARGYDLQIQRDQQCIAVQIKNHKAKCSIAQLLKFQSFLELPESSHFTDGYFISASGFGKPALAHVEIERPANLRLGTLTKGKVTWNYPAQEPEPAPQATASAAATPAAGEPEPEHPLRYIGVFTCKGGVGKTTVAAHLAGAFALMGHDVILVDLDPDKNLRKLFLQDQSDEQGDASLYVPPRTKGQVGSTITVLNHDQWNEESYRDTKIVICDCSPVLAENPRGLMEKFDYCIIPTTLNPLGIAKNADVITRTFKYLREINSRAQMFSLINGYDGAKEAEKRNEVLLAHLERHLESYTEQDPKCKFIHPDAAKVRHSTALLYWGYHIVEGSTPQLAFREIAGRSTPRTDFLQLAEYLERHTDLDQLRREEDTRGWSQMEEGATRGWL